MGKSSNPDGHQTRLPWTPEEDAILIQMVERIGEKRWPLIAAKLPGRTGKGCSHRWRTYLRPDVKHPHLEPFTEWEAAVIVLGQREHANNWLHIAKLLLPGRSNTAVKNYWHCRLKAGVGLKSNSFLARGLSLPQLLNDVPPAMRTYPIAQPPFPSVAPSKVVAQRVDTATGLPLPSGPIAGAGGSGSGGSGNGKGGGGDNGGSTFTMTVARVGRPAAGPPPGVGGADLAAAASEYVARQLATLGAASAAAAGKGAGSKNGGDGAGGAEGRLVPRFASRDDDSALSGGASLAPLHRGALNAGAGAGTGAGAALMLPPTATVLPDGSVAVPLQLPAGAGGALAPLPAWPAGVAAPQAFALTAAAAAAAAAAGCSNDGDDEVMSGDELDGMLDHSEGEDDDATAAATGTGAAATATATAGDGAAAAGALLEGSTAAAAAALGRCAGGPVPPPLRLPLIAAAPVGPVSPFAAFQAVPIGGLFGAAAASLPAAGVVPATAPSAAAAGRWDSGASSCCEPPPFALHGAPGLRHLLPQGRPASGSASLSCRTGSWEDEVKAVGSPLAPRASAGDDDATGGRRADAPGVGCFEASSAEPAVASQQQQHQQQQGHGKQQQQQRLGRPPLPPAARAAHEPRDANLPNLGLSIRLAGVAAAAAARADEAADGGTPVAAAGFSPSAASFGALALGGCPQQPAGPQEQQLFELEHSQHHQQQQQQQTMSRLAFAAAPAPCGAFMAARAPSAGLFARQASLGLRDPLPFDWEPFGRPPTAAGGRPSSDDGGAFDALLFGRATAWP